MKWDELKAAAWAMAPKEINDALVGLAADPRFPAIVAVVLRQREGYIEAGCQQNMAADPGKQSHAWGSVFALETLEGELRQRLNLK